MCVCLIPINVSIYNNTYVTCAHFATVPRVVFQRPAVIHYYGSEAFIIVSREDADNKRYSGFKGGWGWILGVGGGRVASWGGEPKKGSHQLPHLPPVAVIPARANAKITFSILFRMTRLQLHLFGR